MCGIIGTTNTNADIATPMRSILHRGPDQTGTYADERVTLGHQRLSIIDLSEAGRQPMADHEGKLEIVYNGEIYNYKALRKELEARGARFRTQTDTEVILEGYKASGTAFFSKLRGMWAFALYDKQKGRIILSRDQFGIKPLYFANHNNHLYFASEMKAMRTFNLPLLPNTNEYYVFWNLGYFISPSTCYKDIFTLRPGEIITYDLTTKTLARDMLQEEEFEPNYITDEKQAVDALHDALLESIEAHYVADVPVGILFSGGTDSSAIAALSHAVGETPRAYHLAIEGSEDTRYASEIARHLNLNSEAITMTKEELIRQYDAIWDVLDVPFADISVIPTSLIFTKIKGNSKVVLSGEAGDELFGGYRFHERMARHSLISKNAGLAGHLESLHGMSNALLTWWNPLIERMRNIYLDRIADDVIGSYLVSSKNVDYPIAYQKMRATMFDLHEHSPFNGSKNLFLDRHMYLPNDLLYKNDIASMASSVEARVPFVDKEIFKFVQRKIMPEMCLSPKYMKKYLLKKVLERYLSHDLVYRKKGGFGFSFQTYHVPQFESDVEKALDFHYESAEQFGLAPYRELLQKSKKDVLIKKYSRFCFALVSNWKLLIDTK